MLYVTCDFYTQFMTYRLIITFNSAHIPITVVQKMYGCRLQNTSSVLAFIHTSIQFYAAYFIPIDEYFEHVAVCQSN